MTNNNVAKDESVKNKDKYWGQKPRANDYFNSNEFDPFFFHLITTEPFLGAISMNITKRMNVGVPTAYVGMNINDREVEMGYNPYFFRSLTQEQIIGVLTHEMYHIIFMHIFGRGTTDPLRAKMWNFATDFAINSLIVQDNGRNALPDFALVPGDVITNPEVSEAFKKFVLELPKRLSAEMYMKLLEKFNEEQQEEDAFSGVCSLDGHGQWGEIPEELQERLRDKMKGYIKEAAGQADSKNQWGSVPAEIQELIRKMLRNEVDWRSIMKMFFGRSRTLERISTIKKVSRKMPGIMPGVKRSMTARFAFFIDQSGSMSDKDVALAFAEVEAASKEAEIDVYNFDTEIDVSSHKVWKRGKNFEWCRTRSGGTDFNAVAEFVNSAPNRGKWAGVCILTDGYAPKLGQVLGAKVLWVITPQGTMEACRPTDLIIKLDAVTT